MGDPALVYGTAVIALGTCVLACVNWIYAGKQLADQREAERVRLTMIRRDKYESEAMKRYRHRLAWMLQSSSDEALERFDSAVPDFFDVTGTLLRRGYLANDLVETFFGYAARRYWRGLEATLRADSARYHNENLWRDFRYLVTRLGDATPTDEELRSFWEEETSLSVPSGV